MSLTDDLRSDPSCIEIEFAGETRPFLLSVYGARVARDEMEVDFVRRLLSLIRDLGVAYTKRQREIREEKDLPEDEEIEVPWDQLIGELDISTDELEAIAAAVYAGLVAFDEEVTPKQIEMRLTVATLRELLPQIGPTLFSFLQDQGGMDNGQVPQDDVEEAAVGK